MAGLPFPDYTEGQCINCGFFGKRDPDKRVTYCHEITLDERASGEILERYADVTMPWCFVRAARLQQEIDEGDKTLPLPERTFTVITKARDCSSFYPYTAGLDPKEHREEFRMLEMEERRREFDTRMEKDRRRFELLLAGFFALVALSQIVVALLLR